MLEITSLRRTTVNDCGSEYEVTGTFNNQQFHIGIFCEYDGRDVDSWAVNGSYDPMQDFNAEPAFFDKLCERDDFTKLHNEGYEIWQGQ